MGNQDSAGPLKFVNIIVPMVGFVCYFMWKDERPVAANEMLKWGIIGMVLCVVVYPILAFVFTLLLSIIMYGSMFAMMGI